MHGVPRVTGDLDIWIEPSPDNASKAWSALIAFGAPVYALGIRETDLATPDVVVQFGLPPFRIDVLTSISGVTFDEACADLLDGHLFGVPVSFLGRTTFIRNKRASGRPRDLQDIRWIEGHA